VAPPKAAVDAASLRRGASSVIGGGV
jgi:hypothetical protein